jgi:hypothetical protein
MNVSSMLSEEVNGILIIHREVSTLNYGTSICKKVTQFALTVFMLNLLISVSHTTS